MDTDTVARDNLGLSITMLDADYCSYLAQDYGEHSETAKTLNDLSDHIAEAVRDIGILRSQRPYDDRDDTVLAYYVLSALYQTSMMTAAPTARAIDIERVEAAISSFRKGCGLAPADDLDKRAHSLVLAMMAYDAEALGVTR